MGEEMTDVCAFIFRVYYQSQPPHPVLPPSFPPFRRASPTICRLR